MKNYNPENIKQAMQCSITFNTKLLICRECNNYELCKSNKMDNKQANLDKRYR